MINVMYQDFYRLAYITLLAISYNADFLLGFSFDPEDGGGIFVRNIGWLSTDYTALYVELSSNIFSFYMI
jgi:hypothetical protein